MFLYLKGSQGEIMMHFCHANSADPDEMLHNAALR